MIPALLLSALAFAQVPGSGSIMTIETEGDLTPGSTLTVTVAGVVPGERLYLTTSEQVGSSCPEVVAPSCLDLDSPRVISQGRPRGDTVVIEVTVPELLTTRYLQAVSASGVSQVLTLEPQIDVTLEEGTPTLNVTGAAVTCAADAADLIVEFIGGEADVYAVGFLDGVEVSSSELTLDEPLPGAVFFYAAASSVEATNCDEVTWVFEVDNGGDIVCGVKGIDSQAMVDAGQVPATCARL